MEVTRPIPITKQMVWMAFKRVRENQGGAGVDGESLQVFEGNLKDNLYKIWNRLSSGSYFPPPVKQVNIPKVGGKVRKLGVPTVSDRVAQMVVKQHLEPMLETHFHAKSFGYRTGRGAKQALEQVRQNCFGYDWVIDLDIKGFFDELNHELLLRALRKHTQEKWVEMYVERWLKAPMEETDGTKHERSKGTPQGGVISPLLANLFLHYAFDKWMDIEHPGVTFVRYADDIVVHCRTLKQSEFLLDRIEKRLEACGLTLHPEKTKIVYCKQQGREINYQTVSFDFLGYTFKPRRVKISDGRLRVGFGPAVSKAAKVKFSQEIKNLEIQRWTSHTLEEIALKLNSKIRGWLNYFTYYRKYEVRSVLQWLEERLLKWARNRYKRLRGSFKRTARWFVRQYVKNPMLFAHWEKGFVPCYISQRL